MNDRVKIPDPPAEWSRTIDYRNELELARFSRASYLDSADIDNRRLNPDHEHLFDEELGLKRWLRVGDEDRNSESGFVAYAFINESQKRVVIAIRGSDNFADWIGPDVALARDGELLDMLKLPSPATDRTREQMAALQEKLLPGDAWDPQFKEALDFALEVRDRYEAQGYRIETTGHSLGGGFGQVLSHTFGWGGRSFDAPGAANIVESQGYRQWLADNNVTPAQVPKFRPSVDATESTGFLNYEVNNSLVSKKAGPHLGESQSISSFTGREGLGSHARYAAGLLGGGIAETPLLGQALKATGGARLAMAIGYAAHGGQHGVDVLDRHDTDRIVALFEEAVRRQERGDRQPLPIWGSLGAGDAPLLAEAAQGRAAPEVRALDCGQQAMLSVFDGPGDAPFARLLEATLRGDADAIRAAADAVCATPEAQALLQTGREQLHTLQQAAPAHDQANEEQMARQQAAASPMVRG